MDPGTEAPCGKSAEKGCLERSEFCMLRKEEKSSKKEVGDRESTVGKLWYLTSPYYC